MEQSTTTPDKSDNTNATALQAALKDTTTTDVKVETVVDKTPVSKFTELLSEDGKFINDWTEKLPEGFKEHQKTLSKFKDPTALITSYISLEKEFSKRANGVKLPNDDATDEDWVKYRDAVGAPKEAKEYGLVKPEGIEDAAWNGKLADSAASVAVKYGIPKKALHELAELYNGSVKELVESAETSYHQQADKVVHELKTEWGVQAKGNFQKAQRAATALGLDTTDPSIGNNPSIIKALLRVDGLLGEDKGLVAGSKTDTYQERYDRLLKSNDYLGKNGTEKQLAVAAELKGLWKAMNSK